MLGDRPARIAGNRDRAAPGDRQIGFEISVAVERQDADPVSALDAPRQKPPREPRDAILHLPPGSLPVALDGGNPVAADLDGPVQSLSQIHIILPGPSRMEKRRAAPLFLFWGATRKGQL